MTEEKCYKNAKNGNTLMSSSKDSKCSSSINTKAMANSLYESRVTYKFKNRAATGGAAHAVRADDN